jgi:hypothetical protein
MARGGRGGRGAGRRGRGGRGGRGAVGGARGGNGPSKRQSDGNAGFRREDFDDEIDDFEKGRDKVSLNPDEDSDASGSEEDEAVFDVKGGDSEEESDDEVGFKWLRSFVSCKYQHSAGGRQASIDGTRESSLVS